MILNVSQIVNIPFILRNLNILIAHVILMRILNIQLLMSKKSLMLKNYMKVFMMC